MRFRATQFFAAVCLLASLLAGSALACPCSPHHETAVAEHDACHDSHKTEAKTSIGRYLTDECTCIANAPSPAAIAKQGVTEQNTKQIAVISAQIFDGTDIQAETSFDSSEPLFTRDLLHSDALTSLLPSRAPPRL